MSTLFYYQETNIKPLTLHPKDSLHSRRGCKAQRIQFHRRGITTAWSFNLDPPKSELIESHQDLFHKIHGSFQSPVDKSYSCKPVKN